MGEGGTGKVSDIVKAKSSKEDPRATGGLISNLPHPRVNKTKQHNECLTCKCDSVGQSEGLLFPGSSVRFRLNPENSNSHGFDLHKPSSNGAKLLLKVT